LKSGTRRAESGMSSNPQVTAGRQTSGTVSTSAALG
jgi:hypothetical protein